MNIWDILIAAVIVLMVAGALYSIHRKKASGACTCGDCANCSGCALRDRKES